MFRVVSFLANKNSYETKIMKHLSHLSEKICHIHRSAKLEIPWYRLERTAFWLDAE